MSQVFFCEKDLHTSLKIQQSRARWGACPGIWSLLTPCYQFFPFEFFWVIWKLNLCVGCSILYGLKLGSKKHVSCLWANVHSFILHNYSFEKVMQFMHWGSWLSNMQGMLYIDILKIQWRRKIVGYLCTLQSSKAVWQLFFMYEHQ